MIDIPQVQAHSYVLHISVHFNPPASAAAALHQPLMLPTTPLLPFTIVCLPAPATLDSDSYPTSFVVRLSPSCFERTAEIDSCGSLSLLYIAPRVSGRALARPDETRCNMRCTRDPIPFMVFCVSGVTHVPKGSVVSSSRAFVKSGTVRSGRYEERGCVRGAA
ncbi:hypothetical protein BU16DRAFT_248722 [Lophium mytilinum]|uniref:Uncharacterized protein n=1 Tax=Lophium mytilinum TaxID=390894 RepID=A0A6A6R9N5_9PEZI|nr:hypothetical protein BU16DRAFT_248722 [Lophium mytilinum]